eukprot:TRINITY_DN45322_c1_g1_i1.p1 TRINITY_DN45322_c1_g1~~TRINITY_DN45322_c1_g1_i1.p1  ORF type:complete len:465 (-),score=85.65 TRINITY_DN45322_c1_g1_i1:20-1414(-)
MSCQRGGALLRSLLPRCGPGGRGGVRGMSIMERYRRLRPAPESKPKYWDTPPEFRDARDGTEGLDDDGRPILSRAPAGASRAVDPPEVASPSGAPRRPPTYARAPVPTEALVATWETPVQPVAPRSLNVGLAGPPNSGKSSLLNALLGCPLSAVSPKVNTTRDDVRGIKTSGSTQLVFLDVPGIIPSHDRKANRELVAKAWRGYQECQVCLLVIDVLKRPTQELFDMVRRLCPRESIGARELRNMERAAGEAGMPPPALWLPRSVPRSGVADAGAAERPPVVLVLNKIDACEEFRWVQSREREFCAHGFFERIFYMSAKRGQGLEKLNEYLEAQARPGEWKYPADLKTTLPYVDQLKHQINTHLFKWFNSDLPYKIEHQTIGWTPRLDGTLLVEHELIVKDSVVARMILGVRNTILVRLKDQVSYKLRKMWGVPVEVMIWVRPLKQRLSKKDLARMGTGERDFR